MEKKVSTIAWIPLQLVALMAVGYIEGLLLKLTKSEGALWPYGIAAFNFSLATFIMLVIASTAVAIVGWIILFRHEYGSKKFWKHCGVWYVVYLALTIGIIIYEGYDWGILGRYYYISFAVSICLYPVVALLCLMLVMAIAAGIKKMTSSTPEI